MENRSIFNRKLDLTKCAHNFLNEIKKLCDNTLKKEFKEEIIRKSTIGLIEYENTRPLIWKIILNEKDYESIKSLSDIINIQRNKMNKYNTKIKLLNSKKKFSKDPLDNSSDSEWKQFYQNQDVKKLLKLDLLRTYPSEDLFKSKYIQDLITNVLVLWSSENSELSYRQGMNEISAVIIYSIFPYYFLDNKNYNMALNEEKYLNPEKNIRDIYMTLFNEKTLESDVYEIFNSIMKNGMKDIYDINVLKNSEKNNLGNYKNYELFSFKIENEENYDTTHLKKRCDIISKNKLEALDVQLYNHFINIQLNCSIFLQKWIKCIFNREFNPEDVILLWDVIFAYGNEFEFIDYISLSIIESFRDQCIYFI